jgi:RNA polymerase sigma-70 factor (ECF subfamily)
MKAVHHALPEFRRTRTGAFRAWLKTITRHKIIDRQRREENQPVAQGGTSAPDPAEEEEAVSAPEEDGILYRQALVMIQVEFNDEYQRAFDLVVLQDRNIRDAAELMGVEPEFIYQAKSRILRRLRQEFEGLLPD